MTLDSLFADIIGNDLAKQYLQHMISSERVGNSLLFSGCDGVGKGLFALALARTILCRTDPEGRHRFKLDRGIHPDLHIYRPEGKIAMHSMDTLRALTEQVTHYPTEAAKQVFIIHDAERMLPTSANALLKTFEEPSPQAVIVLLSSNPQALLPTVRSRCRTLSFQPVEESTLAQWLMAKHGCEADRVQTIAIQARGSVAKAVRLLQGDSGQRKTLLDLLATGKVATYKALGEALNPICEAFDAFKEQLEASFKESTTAAALKEMSAAQREAHQKEIDGAISLRFREEVQAFLMDILDWYRDLQLIHVGGEQRLLMHRDYVPQLTAAMSEGRIKPLEQVEKAVDSVKVLLDRSTPLKNCLEGLFLKLGFL